MIKSILVTALEALGYPVYLQGTLATDEAYPDSFITIWTDNTADDGHYDDAVTAYGWYFSVIFYTNNPSLFNTVPTAIRTALKNVYFIADGKGRDIPSDVPTHTGWAIDFIYKEKISN